MGLTLLGQNLLELSAATTTVSPAAAGSAPITRIKDRDKTLQYQGSSAAQTDIDVDFGSAQSVTAWGLVNHNATGVTVTLYADSTPSPTTVRDSFSATGVDVLRTFAALSFRYWRVRIPALAGVPKVGELLIGTHRTISLNPYIDSAGRGVIANVVQRRSPGGYRRAAKLGSSRVSLPYRWTVLPEADLDTLKTFYGEIADGAKSFLLSDERSVLRWMNCTAGNLAPVPVGGGQYEVAFPLEESL